MFLKSSLQKLNLVLEILVQMKKFMSPLAEKYTSNQEKWLDRNFSESGQILLSRVLGIDYGERRMGLAVSDSLEIIAKPLKTLDRKKTFDYFSEILNLVIEKNVHKIVVWLPLTLKGKHSDQTKVVQKFIEKLKQAV